VVKHFIIQCWFCHAGHPSTGSAPVPRVLAKAPELILIGRPVSITLILSLISQTRSCAHL
jgi:hypothetical protein